MAKSGMPPPPKNIYEHLVSVISIMHNQTLQTHVLTDDWMLTAKINVGQMTSTDFDMTTEQKQWLFDQGQDAIDEHIQEVAGLLEKGIYPKHPKYPK